MKRGKKMLLLLALLAVMIGGVVLVRQMNQPASVSEASGTFDLIAKTSDDLSGLSWTKGESTWSFTRADGTWTTTEQPSWPVNQDTLQELADQLTGLQGTRRLENISSPADYGLDAPILTVTASWTDGNETVFSVGDATPFSDGYYLKLSGEESVIYTVAEDLTEAFDLTREDMARLEEIPVVEDPVRLTVGSSLDISRAEKSTTVDPAQLWYDAAGSPVDGAQAEDLIASFSGLSWEKLVSASADAAALSGYGLDDASAVSVKLTGSAGETAEILFGTLNEDSNYYARLPGSSMVCTVEGGSVGSLLTATSESLRITAILPMPYESLASATFTTEKGTWELKPAPSAEAAAADAETGTAEAESGTAHEGTDAGTAAESTDADAAAVAATAAEAEASEAESARKALWTQVNALESTGSMDQDLGDDILLSIRAVSTDGAETTVLFAPCSATHYLARVDGGSTLLVPAEGVDAIIRTVRTLQ